MTEWHYPEDITSDETFMTAIGGNPLVARILAQRGITDLDTAMAFLHPERYTPASPTDLPDVDITAGRLLEAISKGERILVWGDFDVDGQTSTSLLVDALRKLNADVGYHIPHRIKHGHGVHAEVLSDYIDQGYEVILTCDTGVGAHEAVQTAYIKGATMLITDHHALPPELPKEAFAIVNPQRLPKGHPLRDLPGVGVTYKLVQHLYDLAGRSGEEEQFLDLVALGIVSDVATQRLDTRYLLQLGIDALRNPQRVGLQELMKSAQVDPTNLSSDTIGFQIGPRLNALGRLDDASMAVELLTTHDRTRAAQIAQQLEILNNKRKQIDNQIYGAAQEQIAADPTLLNFEVLMLSGTYWHPGVIGIVASRLVEQYQKPTLLLATPEGKMAGGSARSIPGVDIGAAIAANADLLIGHGGHPGAAGVRIEPDNIPQFRRRLSNTIRETRDHAVKVGKQVDAIFNLSDLSMELAEELDRLAPFGAGNPPIHAVTKNVYIVTDALFGADRKHRRVTIEDADGVSHIVTWWRGAEESSQLPEVFDLLYIPRINDFKGRRSLQLEWVDYQAIPGMEVVADSGYEIIDLRGEVDPVSILPDAGYQVWAEKTSEELPFAEDIIRTRETLSNTPALVIYTIPPGPHELQQALDQTGARTIYIIGKNPTQDRADDFLQNLIGLIKYTLRVYEGKVSILQLASATGQREITIRRGLEWFELRRLYSIEWLDGGAIQIKSGDGKEGNLTELEALQDSISALLAEAQAYRAYFSQSDLETFFTNLK